MNDSARPRILCINAGGVGDLHGIRVRQLARYLDADVEIFDLDKSNSRLRNARLVWKLVHSADWDLVYQESTGIGVGAPLILAALLGRLKYVVSTGDPVGGFFRNVKGPAVGWLFERYERLLYRRCAGFVGWTPYLTGMAVKMGARRAVTIEGAVDTNLVGTAGDAEKSQAKAELGIPADHIVCGLVGSIKWSPRQQYCYGLELVAAAGMIARDDMTFLIVGDGDGMDTLRSRLTPDAEDKVVFTGRVAPERVADVLKAMDVGFITQTLDGLGTYRLTTKMPEYLSAGVPIAMSPTPGFFDYVGEAGWPLPPFHPASDAFHKGLARWLDSLTTDDIQQRRALARTIAERVFDYEVVGPRFRRFINSILESKPGNEP